MFQRSSVYIAPLFCLALISCAGLDTRLPEIAAADLEAEKQQQETNALRQFESDAGVLLNIGWPVLTANANLCPKTRSSIGVKTHRLRSYPKALREAAGRVLGAEAGAQIFHIADGSPAALAGFKRGDVILNVEGAPAKLSGESWETDLEDNMINVLRGDETLALEVSPVPACDYNLRLSQSLSLIHI